MHGGVEKPGEEMPAVKGQLVRDLFEIDVTLTYVVLRCYFH